MLCEINDKNIFKQIVYKGRRKKSKLAEYNSQITRAGFHAFPLVPIMLAYVTFAFRWTVTLAQTLIVTIQPLCSLTMLRSPAVTPGTVGTSCSGEKSIKTMAAW